MQVNWIVLAPALLLLFFPVQKLLPTTVVFRVYEQTPPRGVGRFPWWWTATVWLDPVCGFGGAFLLCSYTFSVDPDAKGLLAMAPALSTFACLLIPLLFRLPVRRDPRAALAPLFFLPAVAFALMPPLVAGIAVVLALCAIGGFRHYGAGFVVGAAALAVAGLVFKVPPIEVVGTAVLVFMPFLFSASTYRVLTIPSRR